MQQTAAATTRSEATRSVDLNQKLSELAGAGSAEETLRLALQIVTHLGARPALVSLVRAGQVVEIEDDLAAVGVRRVIESREAEVALQVTCVGAMDAQLHREVEAVAKFAAIRAELCARRLWKGNSGEKGADDGRVIGGSRQTQKLSAEIIRAARSGHGVLITGESGTGKTTAAAKIHEGSARAGEAFVAINCAAIPEALLEAELFGYEKGAFTGAAGMKKGLFEEASGGTLFLDEIGELTSPMQAKLLKAIEEKTIRRLGSTRDIQCQVRVIAATSRNLPEMIRRRTFREDLFYRLAVLEVQTAPLRERRADIPELISRRLREEQKLSNRGRAFEIEEAAVAALCAYDWPGNIRQLQNVIARLTSLVEDDAPISLEDVRRCLPAASNNPAGPDAEPALGEKPRSREGGAEITCPGGTQAEVINLPKEVCTIQPGETLEGYVARVIMVAIETTAQEKSSLRKAAKRLAVHHDGIRRRLMRARQKVAARSITT